MRGGGGRWLGAPPSRLGPCVPPRLGKELSSAPEPAAGPPGERRTRVPRHAVGRRSGRIAPSAVPQPGPHRPVPTWPVVRRRRTPEAELPDERSPRHRGTDRSDGRGSPSRRSNRGPAPPDETALSPVPEAEHRPRTSRAGGGRWRAHRGCLPVTARRPLRSVSPSRGAVLPGATGTSGCPGAGWPRGPPGPPGPAVPPRSRPTWRASPVPGPGRPPSARSPP